MDSPSRQQFIDQVLEVVAAKFPLVKTVRNDEAFCLKVNGHVATLENLYRTVALRPDDLRRQVERWMVELLRAAEGSPDISGSFEDLKSRLLPMIVADEGDSMKSAITQPFISGLAVAYALDGDRTISYVSPTRFERWKITPEELHNTAIENLVKRSEAMNAHAAQDESGEVYLILFQTMDGYDASRILLPTLHERLREYLGSPFAAAIPNRDILLCFRNDAQTVARLQPQVHTDFSQMPHQVTDKLLLVTPDGISLRD